MERKTIIIKYGKHIFVYIIFLVGIIGHAFSQTFDLMTALTPYTLFIMGTFVLYHAIKKHSTPLLIWAAGTYAITFILEVFGVYTGLIFGGYNYGDVLVPSFLGVPLVIGYNWVFVILGAASIAQHSFTRPLPFALLTGLIAVLFDILLEPVAIKLGYWAWDTGYVPLQNYAAWFAISFAAAWVLKRFKVAFYTPVAIHYFIAQLLFFVALYFL